VSDYTDEMPRSLSAQVVRLRREADEADELRKRMSDILHRTANALHGGPLKDGYWSWHDLPAIADRLSRELAEARTLLREARAPVRELLWCLTVWNDHNFTEADLIRKLRIARDALGLGGINRVDDANDLLTRIDDAMAETKEGE